MAWEKKIAAISGFLASVLVPIALGFVSWDYNRGEKDRAWVQIALDILRDPDAPTALTEWALSVANNHSTVPFTIEAQEELRGGAVLPLPQPALDGAVNLRVAEMDRLQTEGIAGVLDRDLERAKNAYDVAYKLWPVFRNVDEIRSALHVLDDGDDPTDQEWITLDRELRGMDIRGVPENLRKQLAGSVE